MKSVEATLWNLGWKLSHFWDYKIWNSDLEVLESHLETMVKLRLLF
jgi:hypothetical protein